MVLEMQSITFDPIALGLFGKAVHHGKKQMAEKYPHTSGVRKDRKRKGLDLSIPSVVIPTMTEVTPSRSYLPKIPLSAVPSPGLGFKTLCRILGKIQDPNSIILSMSPKVSCPWHSAEYFWSNPNLSSYSIALKFSFSFLRLKLS